MIDSSGSAATVQIEQSDRQPLAALLRDRIDGDAELHALRVGARRRRLPGLASVHLRPSLCPAAFTQAALGECPPPAPEWSAGITEPWGPWLRRKMQRRASEILASIFDQLRTGHLAATGILPATGGPTAVPDALWASTAVALDMRANALLAGHVALFLGIEIELPQPPPRSASRAALDRFVASFDAVMHETERRYTVDELVTAAQATLGNVSGAEIEAALQRSSPAARAGSGRRAAALVPTRDELARAARQAAETRV